MLNASAAKFVIDPLSAAALTTVLTGVLNGATEETGAAAVTGLGRLLRRAGHSKRAELIAADPAAADPGHLAELLSAAAASDVALGDAVREWALTIREVNVDASTTNSVQGGVQGSVVQGRDFDGPMRIG